MSVQRFKSWLAVRGRGVGWACRLQQLPHRLPPDRRGNDSMPDALCARNAARRLTRPHFWRQIQSALRDARVARGAWPYLVIRIPRGGRPNRNRKGRARGQRPSAAPRPPLHSSARPSLPWPAPTSSDPGSASAGGAGLHLAARGKARHCPALPRADGLRLRGPGRGLGAARTLVVGSY